MTLVLAYQHKHMPNKQFLCANIVIGCILNLGPKKKMKAKVGKSKQATLLLVQLLYICRQTLVQIAIQSPEQQNDLSLPELQSW